MPLPLMLMVAKFLEHQQPLTGIPPLITASWVKKYLNDWSLSSQKAKQELDYQITPFGIGACKTIEWLNDGRNVSETEMQKRKKVNAEYSDKEFHDLYQIHNP